MSFAQILSPLEKISLSSPCEEEQTQTSDVAYHVRELNEFDDPGRVVYILKQLSEVGSLPVRSKKTFQSAMTNQGNAISMVVEIGHSNTIVAYGKIVIEPKFIHSAGSIAHVEDLVVEDRIRRQGFGSALLDRLVKKARESHCYKVLVDCSEVNVPFYEKNGFVRKGACMSKYFSNENKASVCPHPVQIDPFSFNDSEFAIRKLSPADFS
eukprot:gene6203-9221_t